MSASTAKAASKAKVDQILCPVCSVYLHFREFPQHWRQEHPSFKDAGHSSSGQGKSHSSAGLTAPRTLHECPACKARVGNLQKHTDKVHSLEGQIRRREKQNCRTQRMAGGELGPAHPDAKMCGFCRAMLQDISALHAHFRVVHGLEPTTHLPNRVHSAASVRPKGSRPTVAVDSRHSSEPGMKNCPGDPYAQEDRERRMDATYGLGGTARERGRFGSSASHDRMDDESSP